MNQSQAANHEISTHNACRHQILHVTPDWCAIRGPSAKRSLGNIRVCGMKIPLAHTGRVNSSIVGFMIHLSLSWTFCVSRGNSNIVSDSLLSTAWFVQCLYSHTAMKERPSLSDSQLAVPKFPPKWRAMDNIMIRSCRLAFTFATLGGIAVAGMHHVCHHRTNQQRDQGNVLQCSIIICNGLSAPCRTLLAVLFSLHHTVYELDT